MLRLQWEVKLVHILPQSDEHIFLYSAQQLYLLVVKDLEAQIKLVVSGLQ